MEQPTAEDEEAERDIDFRIQSVLNQIMSGADEEDASPFKYAALDKVKEATPRESEILALEDAIVHGFLDHRNQLDPILQPYWGCRDRFTINVHLVLCGHRLVFFTVSGAQHWSDSIPITKG